MSMQPKAQNDRPSDAAAGMRSAASPPSAEPTGTSIDAQARASLTLLITPVVRVHAARQRDLMPSAAGQAVPGFLASGIRALRAGAPTRSTRAPRSSILEACQGLAA